MIINKKNKGVFMNKDIIIGLHGKFETDGNFKVTADVDYKIISQKHIPELTNDGIDVLQLIYVDNGLTETELLADIEAEALICTLEDSAGNYTYVPSTRIKKSPNRNGISYVSKSVVVNLGLLQTNEDLASLRTDLIDVCKRRLGIVPDITIADTSVTIITEYTDSELIEVKRTTLRNRHSDPAVVIAKKDEEIAKLNEVIRLQTLSLEKKML